MRILSGFRSYSMRRSGPVSPRDGALDAGRNALVRAVTIVAACMCARLCSAQAVVSVDLKALKAKYEQGLAGIRSDSDKALTNSVKGYVEALKALEQRLQGAGDLDGVLAVRKEKERFGKDKAIPESVLASDCVALRELQLKWQKMPETIEIGRSRKIVTLLRSHVAALEDMKKQLTMQGKVEQAVAAKEEIERLKTSPEVTAAEFVLANAGADPAPRADKPAVARTGAAVSSKPPAMAAGLRASLVLYYSFDRDEGETVTDKSGKGHNGKAINAVWTPGGASGGAMEFEGTRSHIEVPVDSGFSISGAVTIGAWVCTAGRAGAPVAIVSRNAGSKQAGDFMLALYQGRTILCVNDAPDVTGWGCPGDAEIEPKRWYHIMCTWDGSKMIIYVDGTVDKERPNVTGVIPDSGKPVRIGTGDDLVGLFSGKLDEIVIFNRALSEKEVKRMYDAQKPKQ